MDGGGAVTTVKGEELNRGEVERSQVGDDIIGELNGLGSEEVGRGSAGIFGDWLCRRCDSALVGLCE